MKAEKWLSLPVTCSLFLNSHLISTSYFSPLLPSSRGKEAVCHADMLPYSLRAQLNPSILKLPSSALPMSVSV